MTFNVRSGKKLESVARHGSVTEAAKELHYSQPSVSHHLGRLETATGAQLIKRVGRGIRLTARRGAAGRAGERDPGARGGRVCRTGRPRGTSSRAGTAHRLPNGPQHPRPDGVRRTHLLDDPLYLVSDQPDPRLEDHRDSAWVGGCERCRAATIKACQRAGFVPHIAYACDDTVITQSLVAAGMGVAIVNGLALQAHRAPGVHATRLSDSPRRIFAATYGDPPDPPATTALLETLKASAQAAPPGGLTRSPAAVMRGSAPARRA